MRRFRLLVVLLAVVALAGCDLLAIRGETDKITFVSSTTSGGWKYDYYRNTAFPCAISGYQTFVVGTKIGSSDTASAPLWAFMHGGGAGYFDANGNPIPGKGQKTEEDAASLTAYLTNNGLVGDIRNDPAGFRTLAVSYCSHDVYAGTDSTDPHNPNTTPDGKPRTTNGVYEVKAAIEFVQAKYPTSKFFLHGTSAGSAGAYGVAWALQKQGIPPAGVIGDASIINGEAMAAGYAAGYCTDDNDPARVAGDLGPRESRPCESRQRTRQVGVERATDRAAVAHLEPRRLEHVRFADHQLPVARRFSCRHGIDRLHSRADARSHRGGRPEQQVGELPGLCRQRRHARLFTPCRDVADSSHEHRSVDTRRLLGRDHDVGACASRRLTVTRAETIKPSFGPNLR